MKKTSPFHRMCHINSISSVLLQIWSTTEQINHNKPVWQRKRYVWHISCWVVRAFPWTCAYVYVFLMRSSLFILKCYSLELLNNDSNEDYEGK